MVLQIVVRTDAGESALAQQQQRGRRVASHWPTPSACESTKVDSGVDSAVPACEVDPERYRPLTAFLWADGQILAGK